MAQESLVDKIRTWNQIINVSPWLLLERKTELDYYFGHLLRECMRQNGNYCRRKFVCYLQALIGNPNWLCQRFWIHRKKRKQKRKKLRPVSSQKEEDPEEQSRAKQKLDKANTHMIKCILPLRWARPASWFPLPWLSAGADGGSLDIWRAQCFVPEASFFLSLEMFKETNGNQSERCRRTGGGDV